jgi:hypothetical protein
VERRTGLLRVDWPVWRIGESLRGYTNLGTVVLTWDETQVLAHYLPRYLSSLHHPVGSQRMFSVDQASSP